MKVQYTLDNGWVVEKQDNHIPILHVTPLPNTLFNKFQNAEITEAIFEDIANGEKNVKNLFKKHKLHKIIIEQGSVDVKPNVAVFNSATKYFGKGFIVTQEGSRYFLEYLLSAQGGRSRKFEISKEIYEDAKIGEYSTSDLFKKYNLYHLDVPDNDVKD